MADRLIVRVLCAASLVARLAGAQVPDTSSADAAPTRLADIVAAVQTAANATGFAAAHPALDSALTRQIAQLERSGAITLTVDQVAGAIKPPTPAAVARRRQSRFDFGARPEIAIALDSLRRIANGELFDLLQRTMARAEVMRLWRPLGELHRALLDVSLATSMEKLRRYEIKFGPGSAQLNLVEVLLNYGVVAIRLPGFGPNDDGWPGSLELVAAYNAAYFTSARRRPTLLSAGEIGVRHYMFAPRWGSGGSLRRLLRPSHVAAGAAVLGERERALIWPLEGRSRIGPFLAWGEIKIGYLGGRERRLLVSRHVQLVPWVF